MEEVTYRRDTDFLSWRIIKAIATAADSDPLGLEPNLCDVVDVDALTRIVKSEALNEVHIEYGGYMVAVSNDGTVSVDGPATEDHGANVGNPDSARETVAECELRGQGS